MPQRPSSTPASLSVDFSGAEIRRGGGGDLIPEGDYLFQVTGVTLETKKDDAARHYLRWKNSVVEPTAYAGKIVYNNTSLVPENLWQLRTFLVDLLGEKNVPQKALNLPLAKIVAAKPKFGATVADGEPYNNKVKSEIKATFSKADWAELHSTASDDDDEPADASGVTEAADGEDMDEIDVDDI